MVVLRKRHLTGLSGKMKESKEDGGWKLRLEECKGEVVAVRKD